MVLMLADPSVTSNSRSINTTTGRETDDAALLKPLLKKRGSLDELNVNVDNHKNNNKKISPTSTATPTNSKSSSTNNTNNNALIVTLAAWYAASIVCTNTSKSLGLPWQYLTLAQLVIGSLCAYFGITVLHLNGKQSSRGTQWADLFPTTTTAWQSTTILAATFVGGFVTLNMALHSEMHVSVVMTLRAAEPVATLLLGLYFLPNERTSLRAILALIPVVGGAAMASTVSHHHGEGGEMAATTTTMPGILIVLLCNCLFALRTIFTKRLKASCSTLDNFTLFFQLCVIGTGIQLALLCGMGILSLLRRQSTDSSDGAASSLWDALSGGEGEGSILPKLMLLLVLNGVSFYAYLQLSWVVIGQVGAVTHSVCNALRRPVICAAGWFLFGGASMQGVAGALLATLGTLLYAQAKIDAATDAAANANNEDGTLDSTEKGKAQGL